ncbi:hypothetical protein F383_11843 [Gossypium arboreum]|uniref:Uncharacterized protein n=1 Tax=Gossypium arboreum TaxID=29729 RepID=A0A0B0NEF3_GOSAR|nr:hypothetical protein F383_11843 [Gossypium arboreum]
MHHFSNSINISFIYISVLSRNEFTRIFIFDIPMNH